MSIFTKKSNSNSSHPPSTEERGKESFFGVQAKLNIGKSNDQFEAEADSVAEKIVSNTQKNTPVEPFFSPSPIAQTKLNEVQQKEETENTVQEKPIAENIAPVVQFKLEKEETIQNKTETVTPEVPKTAEKIPTLQPLILPKKAEEEIQAKEEEEGQGKEEEKELQMSAGADANPTDNSNLESNLNSSKGSGATLAKPIKNEMESGFGADFSNVKIHNDSNAVQMNKELGSQAFASGNDIYFNQGKYNPNSTDGKHLLAHELTHTVQQGASSVQPKMIQRTPTTPATGATTAPPGVTPRDEANGIFSFEKGGLTYRISTSTSLALTLPMISISSFKDRNISLFTKPLTMPPPGRVTQQSANWNTGVTAQVTTHLNNKITEATQSGGYSRADDENSRVYFFKGKSKPDLNIFGMRSQLLNLAKLPIWDKEKNATTFQIDHIVEHQLGGGDTVANYELLEASANGSSGSSIAWEMNRKIQEAYDVFMSPYYQTMANKPVLPARPGRGNQYVNLFKNGGYNISFLDYSFTLETRSGYTDRFWTYDEIIGGEHLDKIEALTADEMRQMGTEDDPALFISPNGGQRMRIPPGNSYPIRDWLPRVNLTERPDFQNLTLKVDAYKSGENTANKVSSSYPDMTWFLTRVPNTYIFHVNRRRTLDAAISGTGGVFQSLRLPGMSPIQIDQMDLTEAGFSGSGKVLPTVPLISDADIDIIIDGDGVRLRKLFTADEFHFPAPFVIENASLEVSFGTSGLGLAGRIDFGINNVGTGHIQAAASMANGFALEGAFNFDSELFNPAEINVEYKDNIWTIGGRIGIQEGTIRGVKSATIEASYTENTFTASGQAELDIPGIRSGTMEATYSDGGFSIGGQFQLKDDIPGIRGGSVAATISKQNGDENYNVSVTGTAQPNIPGINSSLTVSYENGALTLTGSADYSRGMLSGSVTVGATNRTIGEDGQPTGEPDDTMRVYGGGTLTLQLTPWLAATAGVKFLPNGEMEVTARLAAAAYDVFSRKQFDRSLFSVPTIEIPLFAIPLGPRSLGLVAQVSGGLDFTAGFGPGQLRNLSAEITYNPEHEELTTIAGHGEFVIPADAGLTLHADLGLGLSVAIASLSGGIELAGTLGLEGEAGASVDVNWSPQTGLALDAEGHITVNPKFKFDINAFARASLGIGWFSISETWRYNLASFSWGPDIQFGLTFPVHYREGEPFDMSFDDIEVIYPELDVIDMAKDLAGDVKDDIFS